jgi:hypothetical protein
VTHYTIRYRGTDWGGRLLLIVDDGQGAAYLFSGGELQLRFGGDQAGPRLARRLDNRVTWLAVPEVSPYTLDELRRIATVPEAAD